MSKVGLKITKENISDYVNKSILVYLKPEMPQETKKKGFNLNVSFSWDKRPTGYSGYSGYSATSGFRLGSIENIEEIKLIKVSQSKECVLMEKKDWDWSNGKERFHRSWHTVDSIIDAYYFIEFV